MDSLIKTGIATDMAIASMKKVNCQPIVSEIAALYAYPNDVPTGIAVKNMDSQIALSSFDAYFNIHGGMEH
jgi:hypothetical protein